MVDHSEQLVDELLVIDAQRGRVQAMEILVSRWQKRLWRYASRITGDSEAAWDVTQEAWLGIVRGIGRLSDPARFGPWAFQIVTNKARDRIKRNARARRNPSKSPIEHPRLDDRTSDDLHAILKRLPAKSRTILTLYYLEEFALSDVARILCIPKGTAKSRLHTARTQFKQLWQAQTSADTKGDIQ